MNRVSISTPLHQHPLRTVLHQGGRFLLLSLSLLLSGPVFAGSFIVNTGNTDLGDVAPGDGACADMNGKCSLRAAIEEGNALAGGPHTITFAVAQVDVINGDLPSMAAPFVVTGPVVINGSGNPPNAHNCLNLSDSGTPALGYTNGATGSIVTLLSIGNCSGPGISANGHGYTFSGNFIGVDPTGLIQTPNAGDGIILSASHVYGNVDTSSLDALFQTFPSLPVQGSDIQTFVQNLYTKLATLNPDTIAGNVISGNGGDGINLHSENLGAVFVSGNMIGTDISGNIALANGGAGVHVNAFTFGNVIGPNNVISGNLGNGITVDSPTVYLPNYIMGNRIGLASTLASAHIGNGLNGIYTDTKPDSSLTNKNPSGISLIIGPANFVSDNQGMSGSTDPDLLTSAGGGVYITGSSNGVKVIGNTIGMAEFPAGSPVQSKTHGNAGDGVIVTATGNTIGGSSAGSGNVIAGNGRHGMLVSLSANTSTHIVGNSIGIYPAFGSDLTLGNGFDGIHIDAASSTYIGGPGANDFNVIAGNGRNGIKIRDGGLANGWSNLVQRNQIYANARGNPAALPLPLPPGVGVGIDLDYLENATNPLHTEIQQNYANLDQAQPVICIGAAGEPSACNGFTAPLSVGGTTTLDWTLNTHGPATFRMEFFKIDSADDNTATSMTFLGEQQVTTDAAGLLTGASCSPGRCMASIAADTSGAFVLMTATDITPLLATPGNLGDWKNSLTCFIGDLGLILSACTANDTSEFSNVVAVPSSNAKLNNLIVSSGSLVPSFASATLNYTDAVTNATTTVTVTPTVADATATVKVNGTTVANGSASGPIALTVGINVVTTVVTAQDGTTTQTYTVTVNRAGPLSNNANLNNLTASSGSLVPLFASATLNYTDAVTNATTTVTVTPTVADATATVKVNGTTVVSGSASGAINLAIGMNVVTVVVTAQDGTTTQAYSVTVNRAGAQSNNANLNGLTVSSGSLVPSFASATLNYTDAVTNATTTVTMTPTVADATATVKVNGTTVASGSASGAINLAVGMNVVTTVVTAQDGTTTQTYTVTVNRAGALSNNANLNNLTVSSGSLMPSFASATLNYVDAVTNATTTVTVTPTVADATATVKVNGTTVVSGSASGAINLAIGMNVVTVVVTAQDGTTTQAYSVTMNRAVITTFSGTTFTNSGTATAMLAGGGPTCSFASTSLVGPPAAVPAGVIFPDGLFQFTTSGCTGTITMTVTFPTPFQASENYWKYGPTPGPTPAHWYTLGATNNLNLAGNTATFTIADGGLGDDDLTVNGMIVDQGGPGVQITPVTLQSFTVD